MLDVALQDGIVKEEDLIQGAIKAGRLTQQQSNVSLRDRAGEGGKLQHSVAYFMNQAQQVGIHRNPAVASGNIAADNMAITDEIRKTATMLGLDPHALYADPG